MTNLALEILNRDGNVERLNHTYICLISKVKKPKHTKDFRPDAMSFSNLLQKLLQIGLKLFYHILLGLIKVPLFLVD